jgi:hypothetical protein
MIKRYSIQEDKSLRHQFLNWTRRWWSSKRGSGQLVDTANTATSASYVVKLKHLELTARENAPGNSETVHPVQQQPTVETVGCCRERETNSSNSGCPCFSSNHGLRLPLWHLAKWFSNMTERRSTRRYPNWLESCSLIPIRIIDYTLVPYLSSLFSDSLTEKQTAVDH